MFAQDGLAHFSPFPEWARLMINGLLILDRVCRSIRPSARGNHEYVDWFRITMELWIQHDWRVGSICTPNGTVHERSVNHQVSYPVVLALVGQVLFLRHHVAHGSRLQRRQLLLDECLDAVDDLSFGLTG